MRAKIRAADANVYNVADVLSGIALPLAAAHAISKGCHLVQDSVNFWHHILSVDKNRFLFRSTQSYVQNGTILRDINFLSPEHGINAFAQSRRLSQLQKQAERIISNAVLRII